MEEVAVMAPSIVNNDELSDETESINLDLHVSDTEDSPESLKKDDVVTNGPTETEEDILNKFVHEGSAAESVKEKETSESDHLKSTVPNGAKLTNQESEDHEKCNGVSSPLNNIEDKDEDMEKTLTNENERVQKAMEEVSSIFLSSLSKEVTLDDENDDASKDRTSLKEKEENSPEDLIEEKSEEKLIESESNETLSEETNTQTTSDLNQCETSEQTNSDEPISDSNKKVDDSEKTKDNIDEDLPKESENSSNEETTDLPKTTDESKTDELEDNDDLLCVMDEKTEDEAANDNKDESSCSASEKDDDTKETENEEEGKDNEDDPKDHETEETSDETEKEDETTNDEENPESQMDIDIDSGECAMDIEESDIGGVYDQTNLPDKDANKENEHESESAPSVNKSIVDKSSVEKSTTVSENGLTNGDVTEKDTEQTEDDAAVAGTDEEAGETDTSKKSTKRQLSDSSTEGDDNAKKIKLQETEKPAEKRAVHLLDSFKKFMLDKKLKRLTRFELEELCVQKLCECIVSRSEIGELRQKVLLQEQTIDTWRKEAIVVAKQTRDLKIVHERLMGDMKAMKEQTGKPLVPVKITRSVGLQAIIENPARAARPVNGPSTPTPVQRSPIVNNQNKTVPSPQSRQIKPKATPQRAQTNTRTLQPIAQKDNLNNAKARQIVSSPQQKKNADPKAVIDLTDEDEKNQNAAKTKTATNTASPTVRILNKQNTNNANAKQVATTPTSQQTSKIMFVSQNALQRNSAVMVKVNSNGLVNPQNGLTTIPNGPVSVGNTPVVRTVSQVRVPVSTVTTVRASPSQQPKQIFKHPAPLPAAPSYQSAGKKPIPPKPHLNLTRSSCGTGIVLQWKMPYKLDTYETIVSYQLYAYQETKSPPKTDNWGKIGDVKALELPMAVTLTQFAVGNRYFFAVRAVDGQKRLGPFSEPENILL